MVAATNKMTRILVTGGKGQLARCLQETCRSYGYELLTPSRLELDITDLPVLSNYLNKMKPEIVINTAAWTNVDTAENNENQVFAVNTRGVMNLIKELSNSNTKFIQISTDYVFDGNNKNPIEVDATRSAKSIYGKSKLMAEDLVLDSNLSNAMIIRTSWLYSKFGRNFAKTILTKLLYSEQNIAVVGDQFGQPTSAQDLSSRILDLVERESLTGVLHGTNAGETSWYEYASFLATISKSDSSRIKQINSSPDSIRPSYSVLSHKNWENFQLKPMQDWKEALIGEIDEIIFHLRSEQN
jgi:dTDP-4-dehydrorhamnose reductase